MTQQTPIERAIHIAGGSTALANAIGTTKQNVTNWRVRNVVPPNRCVAIEAYTGVDRRELCPEWRDYWPVRVDVGI